MSDGAVASTGPASWDTLGYQRRVLAVARNLASTTRVIDVLSLVGDDDRLDVQATIVPGSEFRAGIDRMLDNAGMRVLPWDDAVAARFDLALCGSANGDVHLLKAPLMYFSHGAGFHKLLPVPADGKGLSDLSEEKLTHNGILLPSAIMLPGQDSVGYLDSNCSQARFLARISGDPVAQQLREHASRRDSYREALGVRPGQRLVVVSSTWGPGSVAGQSFDLFKRLVAQLPVDEYRVAAIIHPNVAARHGAAELERRLDRATGSGLIVIPPEKGWQATILAADCVIGDHGSVTFYSADFVPIAFASQAAHEYPPDGPIADLSKVVPYIDVRRPLLPQVENLIATHRLEVIRPIIDSSITRSIDAAGAFRSTMYELMDLDEPEETDTVPLPLPEPKYTEPASLLVHTDLDSRSGDPCVTLTRHPAPLADVRERHHLAVRTDEPNLARRQTAAVLIAVDDTRGLDELLNAYPVCRLVARRLSPDSCAIRMRGGVSRSVTAATAFDGDMAWLAASACYALIHADQPTTGPVTIACGLQRVTMRFGHAAK